MISLTSCDLCTVDGGEEGVFIKQPWFFGQGGVEIEPLRQGSEWKVWSTDYIKYSVVNTKYSVSFDEILMAIMQNIPSVSSKYGYSLDAMKKTY